MLRDSRDFAANRHIVPNLTFSRRAALWVRLAPLFLFIAAIISAVLCFRSAVSFLSPNGTDTDLWLAAAFALLAIVCALIFNAPNRKGKLL